MPFKKPILSDFGVCARYLPMQSALQQVFGSYDNLITAGPNDRRHRDISVAGMRASGLHALPR